MQAPAQFDFIPHYQNDGLRSFTMTFKYKSGNPVNLIGSKVRMQMYNGQGQKAWEFSTEPDKDGKLTVGDGGVLTFEKINSWALAPSTYTYDLEITTPDGFVKTFLKGNWVINRDITK